MPASQQTRRAQRTITSERGRPRPRVYVSIHRYRGHPSSLNLDPRRSVASQPPLHKNRPQHRRLVVRLPPHDPQRLIQPSRRRVFGRGIQPHHRVANPPRCLLLLAISFRTSPFEKSVDRIAGIALIGQVINCVRQCFAYPANIREAGFKSLAKIVEQFDLEPLPNGSASRGLEVFAEPNHRPFAIRAREWSLWHIAVPIRRSLLLKRLLAREASKVNFVGRVWFTRAFACSCHNWSPMLWPRPLD